jgi:hypothetical protein
MSTKPLGEQRIAQMNIDVAAFQRAGKIQEGVALADEAFFAALQELPDGHFLRAQSARNRAIMQFMSGDQEEAAKTLFVALNCYQKTLAACIERRQQLEASGKLKEAMQAAQEQTRLARAVEEIQHSLFGDQPRG